MRAMPVTTEGIREKRMFSTLIGIALAVLGVAAIMAPSFTSEAIQHVIGWLLLVAGLFTAVTTWFSKQEGWKAWLGLGGAVAAVAAGGLLLWSPLGGKETLSAILVAFFAISGAVKVGVALVQRGTIPRLWAWLLASGVVDLAMAMAVLIRWPFNADWFLGLMTGISFLGTGIIVTLIATGGEARRP